MAIRFFTCFRRRLVEGQFEGYDTSFGGFSCEAQTCIEYGSVSAQLQRIRGVRGAASKEASAVVQICRCLTAAFESITRARICVIGPVPVNLLKRAPYHREGIVNLLDIVVVRLCWLLGGRPATRKKLVEVCGGGDCAVRSTDDVFNSVMKR